MTAADEIEGSLKRRKAAKVVSLRRYRDLKVRLEQARGNELRVGLLLGNDHLLLLTLERCRPEVEEVVRSVTNGAHRGTVRPASRV